METVGNVWGIIFGVFAAIASFLFMFQIDKISVLFVILPMIGNFVFERKIGKIEYNRNKDMAPYNRKIAYVNRVMYLEEYAKEVRLTNAFSLMKRYYQESINGVIEVTKKYTWRGMVNHWFRVMFTFTFIFEGVLIYGAYRTLVSHTMSLSQLAVLTSMMVSTTWILIGFTQSLMDGYKNGMFISNLRNFMEYEEKIPEDTKGDQPEVLIESIEFRNVYFSYKGKRVIKNLSFVIEGGKTYAFVGHNGAGKTTIVKLLLRFYDPDQGMILLNGKNIMLYDLKEYRKLFATAFQDYQMFSLSLAENVLMRKVEDSDEEIVVKALEQAGIYEKIKSLPMGIHTTLTREFDDEGAVLSGGEFQKISIARAFAKDCPIKVFDEPSSALDPIAEHDLFHSILKYNKKQTMIFISHRLSSVQSADVVFMFENGELISQGSHEQLMKDKCAYRDMYQKQAENYLAINAEGGA